MQIKIKGGTPFQLVRFSEGTFPSKFRFDENGEAVIIVNEKVISEKLKRRFPDIIVNDEKPLTKTVKQISEKPIEKPATKKTIDYPTNRKELIKLAKEIIETGKIEAFPLNIKSEEIIEKLKGVK